MTQQPVRFETLIEHHHDEIYSYLWRMMYSAGYDDYELVAQDLTQDVFLKAYRAYNRLRANSNYRAWLYKIATNCAMSRLKQQQRDSVRYTPLDDNLAHNTVQAIDERISDQEFLQHVERRIVMLPAKQRMALVMRYVHELDYAEIAEALGCSQESARANVYQALKRLRREIEAE